MKLRYAALTAGLCLAVATASSAFDTIKTGTETIRGTIEGMTNLNVTIKEGRGGLSKEVPVNQIDTVFFDEEPSSLKTARTHIKNGRFNDGLAALAKVDLTEIDRPEIRQDVAFFKALCSAHMALGGNGSVVAAGRQMAAFELKNKNNYHWLEANEMVGDLLVAAGLFDKAETYYARVGEAPWPDYKMRATVAVGRAQLSQGKIPQAVASFEKVLAMPAEDELAQGQRMAATLGKARCLAATGEHGKAITAVEKIIAKADPEEVELHARAYNTLGTALRKAGRDKEALRAFLHVDVLYFAIPDAHAEALFNLAELWKAQHKTEREVRARQLLEEQYRNSPWAKKGGE